jgi:hypothetical protein
MSELHGRYVESWFERDVDSAARNIQRPVPKVRSMNEDQSWYLIRDVQIIGATHIMSDMVDIAVVSGHGTRAKRISLHRFRYP